MGVKLQYADAAYVQCGRMLCLGCRKKIEKGYFRYFMNRNEEYDGHYHRACSLNDKEWTAIDLRKLERLAEQKAYLQACISFKHKWATDALDDEIEQTTEWVRVAEEALNVH